MGGEIVSLGRSLTHLRVARSVERSTKLRKSFGVLSQVGILPCEPRGAAWKCEFPWNRGLLRMLGGRRVDVGLWTQLNRMDCQLAHGQLG